MKTKLEIIDETVAYYSEDVNRRGVVGVRCQYLTDDGRMCAVGRCMEQPGSVENHTVKDLGNVDLLLKPEYRGHDVQFWNDLQLLHDRMGHWSYGFWSSGLSDAGKRYVDTLKRRYAEE